MMFITRVTFLILKLWPIEVFYVKFRNNKLGMDVRLMSNRCAKQVYASLRYKMLLAMFLTMVVTKGTMVIQG